MSIPHLDSIPAFVPAKTVEDMFDLAAPAVKNVVAKLVPVDTEREAIEITEDVLETKLGRSKDLPEVQRFTSGRMSNMHCKIVLELPSNLIHIVDTSTNGTFLNSVRLTKGEKKELSQGDSLTLVNAASAKGDELRQHSFIFQRLKPTMKMDTLSEELTCGICRSVFYKAVSVLPCLHSFCSHCISGWLKKQHICPECRVGITEVRPSHKLNSLVDHLVANDPSLKYTDEEKKGFDAENTIPPTGRKVKGSESKRPRDDDDDADGFGGGGFGGGDISDDGHDDSDDGYDDSDDGSEDSGLSFGFGGGGVRFAAPAGTAVGPMTMMIHPPAPVACPQCSTPAEDGFQCPPGQMHVSCQMCKQPFPSRPLCDTPQRCEICNVAFCDLYLGGCKNPSGVGYLQPVEDHTLDILPKGTLFSGNNIEITILERYLEGAGISTKTVWEECLKMFKEGTWKPAMTTIKGDLKGGSVVCKPCCQRVFSRLLFHYRRAIPRDALPPAVTARADCWFGLHCRTQKHNPMHAQNYNHICDQVKRKE